MQITHIPARDYKRMPWKNGGGMTTEIMAEPKADGGNAAALVFFAFDLLYIDGDSIASLPVIDRKKRLRILLGDADQTR